MVDCWDRVLPDEHFRGDIGAEIAGARPHVTVRELEPGAREGIGELVGILQKAARNLLVGRVDAHREICRQHGRTVPFGGVVRVRDQPFTALGHPLLRPSRTLRQFPLEAEQVLEIVVAPLRRRAGPGDLQPAGDGVATLAGAEAVLPAEALVLDAGRFRLVRDVLRRCRAVGLAEAVTAGDECDRFLVVHRHARERLPDVDRRGERVGLAVRAFRIDVDQAHLHGGQRILEVPRVRNFAVVVLHQHAMVLFDSRRPLGVADVAAQPFGLATPVHVLVRLPHVFAATGEAEGLEAHRFQRDVAGENHQIGPGNLPAVLLLDRPQQAAGLVQAHVVRPAVERREALLAAASTTAAVADAVGAGAVPCHADEQAAVMAEVRRPPVLRIRHQCGEVLLHGRQIQALERFGVVELLTHRVGLGGVLMQQFQGQSLWPPVAVGRANSGGCAERALGFGL